MSYPDHIMTCPPDLQTTDYLPWSRGRGVDVWDMFVAAMNGDLDTIKRLVTHEPALINCEYQYLTPLHFAFRENQLEVVKYILSKGVNPLYGFGDHPLQIAKDRGYTHLADFFESWLKDHYHIMPEGEEIAANIRAFNLTNVRSIIDAQPHLVHAADKRGNQPIHWASLTRQIDLIDYLLKKGAHIGAMRPDGAKPIDLTNGDYHYRNWYRDLPSTALRKHEVVLGYLMAKGAWCDISVAARIGYYDRVKELLDQYGDLVNKLPDYVTYYNGLPLRNAAANGHLEIVKLLLERGADVNAPEPGIAPFGGALHAAVGAKHFDIAMLLLEHGADPNAHVESSGDILFIARAANAPKEFIDLIVSKATNRNKDIIGYESDYESLKQTLNADPKANVDHYLGHLISEGRQAQLELIVKYQPDIFKKQTMLSAEWWNGGTFHSPEQARWILEKGLNPNLKNWLGITMLHRCAAKGLIETAEVLLEFGADINAIEAEWSSTPLGWAARHRQAEMVKWLRQKGADPRLPKDKPWAWPEEWSN